MIGIVNESLLCSDAGKIEILPSLPERWAEGSISGLSARTNAAVSIQWANGKATAQITSNIDQTIKVSCNGGDALEITFAKGETKTVEFSL